MQGERALLRALYRVEELTEEMITADVSRHTQAANASDKVHISPHSVIHF